MCRPAGSVSTPGLAGSMSLKWLASGSEPLIVTVLLLRADSMSPSVLTGSGLGAFGFTVEGSGFVIVNCVGWGMDGMVPPVPLASGSLTVTLAATDCGERLAESLAASANSSAAVTFTVICVAVMLAGVRV